MSRATALVELWFQVRGNLAFPIDMLRYDACHPYTESDAHAIERSIQDSGSDSNLLITLKTLRPEDWRPSDDRWRSRGWSVVRVGGKWKGEVPE